MKQGRASRSGPASQKVEPRSRAVNPTAVSQMGNLQGNHVTDKGDLPFRSEPLYQGRGYKAPMAGKTVMRSGSQGRH